MINESIENAMKYMKTHLGYLFVISPLKKYNILFCTNYNKLTCLQNISQFVNSTFSLNLFNPHSSRSDIFQLYIPNNISISLKDYKNNNI